MCQSRPSLDPRRVIVQQVEFLPHCHCPEHAPVFAQCFVILTALSACSRFRPQLSLVLRQTWCYFLRLRKGGTLSGPHPLPLGPLPLAAAAPLLRAKLFRLSGPSQRGPQTSTCSVGTPRPAFSRAPVVPAPTEVGEAPSLLAFSDPFSASSHYSSQIIVPSCHLF